MTKRFKWDDKYSVNVPSLDEQHKGFFDITNKIVALLERPQSRELKRDLIKILAELGEYAIHHLNYEEGCIHRYKCEGCDDHPDAHDVYREKVKDYLRKSREPNTDIYSLAEEVAEFSQNWLATHILNKDRDYIPCMTEHNVQ